MGPDKRVQILLSTYNGEEYLREQLDSYLSLEGFQSCCVLIRDDGSTDGTKEILQEYRNKFGFEVYFGKNIGVTGSYQWLFEHCNQSCDYFALSDQDDVWLPEKVKVAVEWLNHQPSEIPAVFASRSCITDSRLNKIGYSIAPKREISFYNAMVQNVLPGHTQVLNRKLCNILAENGLQGAHVVDWWIYLVASALGNVLFYEKPTVLHRQHGQNTVGYRLGFAARLRQRISYIRAGKGNSISVQIYSFYQCYKPYIKQEYAEEIERYLHNKSLFNRLFYVKNHKVYRQKRSENFAFWVLYLLGKYNLLIKGTL